jgi:S1-C subfamily serine protease
MRVGDVLVALNGTPIHNDQDVHRASEALRYDQHVDLEVWRGGKQVRLRAQM